MRRTRSTNVIWWETSRKRTLSVSVSETWRKLGLVIAERKKIEGGTAASETTEA